MPLLVSRGGQWQSYGDSVRRPSVLPVVIAAISVFAGWGALYVATRPRDSASTPLKLTTKADARQRIEEPSGNWQQPGLAKFEPPQGCYLGAYIDFDSTLTGAVTDSGNTKHFFPEEFEAKVGREHAIYFFYLGYGKRVAADWLQELAKRGKMIHVALEPNDGLKQVHDDSTLRQLADDLRGCGAPIFLRFGSEMNGKWVKYHNNPRLYREKFRIIADVMHRRAPNVAMVWCPFDERFAEDADTYYPGDDVVDWAGINIYCVAHHNNRVSSGGLDDDPLHPLQRFYRRYADRKPIMIGEFAATHQSAADGSQYSSFAVQKIAAFYRAIQEKFTRVKAINYFDGNNMQYVEDRPYNDYSLTTDPDILERYRQVISSRHFIGRTPGHLLPRQRDVSTGDLSPVKR